MRSDLGAPVRLRLDASRCDGFGMCSVVFPDGITLDVWGYARVEPEPITDSGALGRALRAVRCCPRNALTLPGFAEPGQDGPKPASW